MASISTFIAFSTQIRCVLGEKYSYYGHTWALLHVSSERNVLSSRNATLSQVLMYTMAHRRFPRARPSTITVSTRISLCTQGCGLVGRLKNDEAARDSTPDGGYSDLTDRIKATGSLPVFQHCTVIVILEHSRQGPHELCSSPFHTSEPFRFYQCFGSLLYTSALHCT